MLRNLGTLQRSISSSYVSLYMANIVATAKAEADRKISQERSDIIGSFKDRFILAYINDKDSGSDTLTDILNEIVHSAVPIRPDRSVKRPVTTCKMKFYHNRKLNC